MLSGLHHVTAIASDAQSNVDFFVGCLGLRLVKVTVNFDAPENYHLYYGDEIGRPGTLVTFFVWPSAKRGRKGLGQASVVSFAIPETAIRYWMERLSENGLRYEGPIQRLGSQLLTFFDHDDLQVELVAVPGVNGRPPWTGSVVPGEFGIRGLWGVTQLVGEHQAEEALLTRTLGFHRRAEGANHRLRYTSDNPDVSVLDLLVLPGLPAGQLGAGAIHHVAWRAKNETEQAAWRHSLLAHGYTVTPVLDRTYFRSIYFRTPGGVLYEIATDGPGFTVDEPATELGAHLQLPSWLEPRRMELRTQFAVAQPDRQLRMSAAGAMMQSFAFRHRYVAPQPGGLPVTLLLLHGAGGDETSLLPIAAEIAPGTALISPRGKTLVDGMLRFFPGTTNAALGTAELDHDISELADFAGDRGRLLPL